MKYCDLPEETSLVNFDGGKVPVSRRLVLLDENDTNLVVTWGNMTAEVRIDFSKRFRAYAIPSPCFRVPDS